MYSWLWLIPTLPLAGFVALVIGRRLPHWAVAAIGCGSVALAAAVTLAIGTQFLAQPPQGHYYRLYAWTWLAVGNFTPQVALYLDELSLLMIAVITVVGLGIHIYSAAFMAQEEGYGRFFAYMNLFVASMLLLVLGDNLLLLYAGWEGVGLCSYLLIGFWYKDAANGRAAMKAFIVTRVGDTAMALGLFLIFFQLGTLQIAAVLAAAPEHWAVGSPMAVAAAALLLGGAVGKSAQLPLQTWLPDAMAGPTPVSALIHAATMVTAGVYLIARTHVLFTLAPSVQLAVAVIGGVTLVIAGCSAIVQHDIKRVLAYSTISQIGYMFLALGAGAWSSAMFHFMTHAFFKSLLFLAAGVVILAMNDDHNMHHMGGLRKKLPVAFWTFLIGALSLTALPPVTGGLASKDLILCQVWTSGPNGPWLWAFGIAGVLITSIYTFRMVFLTFFGESRQEPNLHHARSKAMSLVLIVLAAGAALAGLPQMPHLLGGHPWFEHFMEPVFQNPAIAALPHAVPVEADEATLQMISLGGSVAGLVIAYLLFLRSPQTAAKLATNPYGAAVGRYWLGGWGFDRLYDLLIVRPIATFSRVNKDDAVDLLPRAVGALADVMHWALRFTQTGRVRWYAAGIAFGAAILVAMVVFS